MVFTMKEGEDIEFLQKHIDISFDDIMGERMIMDLEWMPTPDGDRPFARMDDGETNGKLSNLICLFPPFIPTGANN